jgi:hypothetical protein
MYVVVVNGKAKYHETVLKQAPWAAAIIIFASL